jgi:hypothetical protein
MPATVPMPSSPIGGEICVEVDFSETAGGMQLYGGVYVEDKWGAYRLLDAICYWRMLVTILTLVH